MEGGIEMKEKKKERQFLSTISKIGVAIGVAIAFYKLPSLIAEKLSYYQLKNKKFEQNTDEEDK